MGKITDKGNYKLKTEQTSDSITIGEYNEVENKVYYSYEYTDYETMPLADIVAELGDSKVKSLVCRQYKVDANNTTREKVKTANEHSARPVLTPEQKADAKVKRQADKDLLSLLKSKGISAEQLKDM